MATDLPSAPHLTAAAPTAAAVVPGFPFVRLPSWEVQVPAFEGPLELLLLLLREGDLEITEVDLARVADQYLSYVRTLADVDVEAVAGFLAVAAHLLVLKSRALVPRRSVSADGDDEPADDDLVTRLRRYAAVQQGAAVLAQRQAARLQCHVGVAPPTVSQPQAQTRSPPLPGATPQQLATIFQAVLARHTHSQPPAPPLRPQLSLSERVQQLRQQLAQRRRFPFDHVAPSWAGPAERVVTFLALLALWHRGEALVQQAALFGAIWVEQGSPQPAVPAPQGRGRSLAPQQGRG